MQANFIMFVSHKANKGGMWGKLKSLIYNHLIKWERFF